MQAEMTSSPPLASQVSGMPLPDVHLSHVSSNNNPYTGEPVTFYTRFRVAQEGEDAQLRISIPNGLKFINTLLPEELRATPVAIIIEKNEQLLIWEFKDCLKMEQVYQIETHFVVEPAGHDQYFLSTAEFSIEKTRYEETLALNVRAKGRYLQFLPELYAEDDLMGRFLMLFESFWSPIEMQIKDIAYTFDPKLTPQAFLPWLGSWLGMDLSESVPVERMRKLVREAVLLNRTRGTRQSLQKYLELFSGSQVRIVEHRANDFRLGAQAELGPNIALGFGNRPHTFTVYLQLPKAYQSSDNSLAVEKFRREIEMIIDEQKPAHTKYKLVLELE